MPAPIMANTRRTPMMVPTALDSGMVMVPGSWMSTITIVLPALEKADLSDWPLFVSTIVALTPTVYSWTSGHLLLAISFGLRMKLLSTTLSYTMAQVVLVKLVSGERTTS